MKKNYETPFAELVIFETEAILASGTGNNVVSGGADGDESVKYPMGNN